MPSLFDKAWSPYVAGVVIGLLQIPAFLIIETALGASSSYVTVGAAIAGWFDPASASRSTTPPSMSPPTPRTCGRSRWSSASPSARSCR